MEKLVLKLNEGRCWLVVIGLMLVFMSFSSAFTDPRDVFAINSLHAALGNPTLPGWVALGGDPCLEAWQGVLCVNSNITEISLNGANLGGQLGTELDSFTSIITIDLSGNHIGGTIPANLPPTMRTFFLSANQFTGSIPDLSALSQLTDLSLNNNNLTGEIPDGFQLLNGLINLDLSVNNLTGPLPPSMTNLSSLTTLHLQGNKLTGTLDVLQDLPLTDLNIENNQFSGPIPAKVLIIPNFRNTGNPFNTSVLPSSPSASPALVPSSPSHHKEPTNTASTNETSSNSTTTTKQGVTTTTILTAAFVVFVFIAVVLSLWFFLTKYCKGRQVGKGTLKGPLKKADEGKEEKYVLKETTLKYPKQAMDVKVAAPIAKRKDDHSIDMTWANIGPMSTRIVPPQRHLSNENIILKPITSPDITKVNNNPTIPISVKSFTVASLQEYTNSFSHENLIDEGLLGSVYRAELPGRKLVAVKKLKDDALNQENENEFAQLISSLSKIQNANIVKLVGYCNEYGQRLIVYEYCNNGTLYEALHLDDELHEKLFWNVRTKIALGAAKALEYFHEICKPPFVHKNFKSNNILLDDNFEPLVSDYGLATLLSDCYTTQLASGYGAPELELGTYTPQSDVFSFGVVMLELLTGRKPYNRKLPREEQFLVRWAIPQLHDIDALSKMVDPSLNGSYPSKSLSRFADIISLCVQAQPEFRPPMSEIVQNLVNMIERES